MPIRAKKFLLVLVVIFLAFCCIDVLFEYFDTGDDPLFSPKMAVRNLIVSLAIAGTIVMLPGEKSRSNQDDS